MEFSGGVIQWNMNFARAAHHWEVCLCLVLQGVVFSKNEKGMGGQTMVEPLQKKVVWC
jgi:hypothetical protein